MFNDIICYFCSPNKCNERVVASETIEIKPKSFAEIPVYNSNMFFYSENFIFNDQLIRNYWITCRGSFFKDKEKESFVYIYNEGENVFTIEKGMVLGKLFFTKIGIREFFDTLEVFKK